MSGAGQALGSLNGLDGLGRADAPALRVDPRAMIVTTFLFIAVVSSFDKYDLLGLLPLVLYPVSLMALGRVSFRRIARRLLVASPFAVMIGIFNPVFDGRIIAELGPLAVSGGWISFASILVKFLLTVSAALLLVEICGFDAVCFGLGKMGVPRVLVSQLLFLKRYIHVAADEAARMVRAHALRSFRRRGMSFRVFGSLCGQLLLRSLDRAQRIYNAMISRGFSGRIHLLRERSVRGGDILFASLWIGFFLLVRLYNIPLWIGTLVLGSLA
ncbi:MAG: cobalt ECF transporter T component CbiQ [Deltaproteobacteria bacterium HGW-Deltaproteobacteria-19]|jgi:cobalt/nickel transport system permease protein|nr:MAG: cobalt ECF transporter T component CbiQ [Deltaproteobacteria bacterium HGW-Deltaproteobacteria-19]